MAASGSRSYRVGKIEELVLLQVHTSPAMRSPVEGRCMINTPFLVLSPLAVFSPAFSLFVYSHAMPPPCADRIIHQITTVRFSIARSRYLAHCCLSSVHDVQQAASEVEIFCDLSLSRSAGCGWPAFDKCYTNSIATRKEDAGGLAASFSGRAGKIIVDGCALERRNCPPLAKVTDSRIVVHEAPHADMIVLWTRRRLAESLCTLIGRAPSRRQELGPSASHRLHVRAGMFALTCARPRQFQRIVAWLGWCVVPRWWWSRLASDVKARMSNSS